MPESAVNAFDTRLPREIRIQIFSHLVLLYVAEEASSSSLDKHITQDYSQRSGCSGLAAGLRQLLCLMSVSKTWLSLVLDGQLWNILDVTIFGHDVFPLHTLSRIIESAGLFMRDINFQGISTLIDRDLLAVTDLSSREYVLECPETNFVSINLTGCRSLTSFSLKYLLSKCPNLQELNLRALKSVTPEVCGIIAKSCPNLNSLDIGFCSQLPGSSLLLFESNKLQVLRVPGLNSLYDRHVSQLGRNLPELVMLDLRYSIYITDKAFEDFVNVEPTDSNDNEQISVIGARLGKSGDEFGVRYTRRVTRLIHLALSGCSTLTDRTCMNLAYSVPRLEIFEFADIGSRVHDDGMTLFLSHVPLLRMIDLGGATNLTDQTLAALTPGDIISSRKSTIPTTGSNLQHAILSKLDISDEALLSFIDKCPKLTILHVDGTDISDAVVRKFVRIVRLRDICGAEIGVIDCDDISSDILTKVGTMVRPRRGTTACPASWSPTMKQQQQRLVRETQSAFTRMLNAHNSTSNWHTIDRLGYHCRTIQAPISNQKQSVLINEYDYTSVVLHSLPTWSLVDIADRDRKKKKKNKQKSRSAAAGILAALFFGGRAAISTQAIVNMPSRESSANNAIGTILQRAPERESATTADEITDTMNAPQASNNGPTIPQFVSIGSVRPLTRQPNDTCLIS